MSRKLIRICFGRSPGGRALVRDRIPRGSRICLAIHRLKISWLRQSEGAVEIFAFESAWALQAERIGLPRSRRWSDNVLLALGAGVLFGSASSLGLGYFDRLIVDWIETLAFERRAGPRLGA